ncbi:sugar ABC transporter permease [Paenibacillus psychroresistens]|uniref:Sugar ABC transporter permease n=1 Tax=Paenibacillus psychroresistens TaxID=1778678 RepID=A0A6B8RW24_9BACL|nr:sugar ABC transporter permease [Paenibacillus psychroresistens]QGQ99416.1 sugar ABC transporter permease [Paenibacillus psychroresistens]
MSKRFYSHLYMLPLLIIYSTLALFPAIMGLCMSFTDWTGTSGGIFKVNFVGFYQFKSIYSQIKLMGISGDVGEAFANTFKYAVTVMILINIFGMLLALIFDLPFKFKGFIRSAFFLPIIFSPLIICFTFSAMLFPDGPIDQFLKNLGLVNYIHGWLTDHKINIYVVSGINIWMTLGFTATIYLAGLKTIPNDLKEAARVDGASPWQNFRNITLPLVAPSITVSMVMSLVGSLKVFDLPYLLTGNQAFVINTLVYAQFGNSLYAYGTAMSLILFLIVCLLTFPMLKLLRKNEVQL